MRGGDKIKLKKKDENSASIRAKTIFGIVVNILLIGSILFLALDNGQAPIPSAGASYLEFEEVDPSEYETIDYDNAEDAVDAANDMLDDMLTGHIQTIDDEDDDNFTAMLIRDYTMGDVIYWSLGDSDTTVFLHAFDEEIIHYFNMEYFPGSMNQAQIESQAATIAGQFATLPTDRQGPSTTFEDDNIVITSTDIDDQSETVAEYDYWYVEYDRVKDNIQAEDRILVVLNPNGYLACYIKVWNMALGSLSTSYTVSQASAEATALNDAGPGSSVTDTQKMIVRPNDNWGEDPTWGTNPMCVWQVDVRDADDNAILYHIDGNNNVIVGGDFTFGYYT
jgi:hypothetical protein